MKFIKKIVLISTSGIFLAGCSARIDDIGYYDRNDNQRVISADEVYLTLSDSMNNYENVTKYDGTLSMDTVKEAMFKIRHDHPDLFWLDSYVLTESNGSAKLELSPMNGYSSEELEKMHRELISAADSLIADMPSGLDDYGKILYVHDKLVLSTDYDKVGALSSKNGLWGTAYGCLVQGNAVCQGYAEAFQYIMNQLGIECGVCTGESVNGSHAWNYVNLNGKYYWLDVTWDDPDFGGETDSSIIHSYFLIDDEHLKRTREVDSECFYMPECFSMDDNYYMHSGTYLTYYNFNELAEILAANSDQRRAEIMFANSAAYDIAMADLFDNGKIWELTAETNAAESITYTNDDTMCMLIIEY